MHRLSGVRAGVHGMRHPSGEFDDPCRGVVTSSGDNIAPVTGESVLREEIAFSTSQKFHRRIVLDEPICHEAVPGGAIELEAASVFSEQIFVNVDSVAVFQGESYSAHTAVARKLIPLQNEIPRVHVHRGNVRSCN